MRLRRRGHLGLSLACLLAATPVTLALAHADATHAVELPVIVATYLATVFALALASRVASHEGCRMTASAIAMGAVVVLAAGALEGAFAVRESTDATLTVATRPVHVADSWAGTVQGDGPYTLELPRNGRIAHPTITVDALTARDTDALDIINASEYGNGACIFTQNMHYAEVFSREAEVGMVGVNVGICAPHPYVPFGGIKGSLLGTDKVQGKDGLDFFTQNKITTVRTYDPRGQKGQDAPKSASVRSCVAS